MKRICEQFFANFLKNFFVLFKIGSRKTVWRIECDRRADSGSKNCSFPTIMRRKRSGLGKTAVWRHRDISVGFFRQLFVLFCGNRFSLPYAGFPVGLRIRGVLNKDSCRKPRSAGSIIKNRKYGRFYTGHSVGKFRAYAARWQLFRNKLPKEGDPHICYKLLPCYIK